MDQISIQQMVEISYKTYFLKGKFVNVLFDVEGIDFKSNPESPPKIPAIAQDYSVVPISISLRKTKAGLRAFIKSSNYCFAGPVTSNAAIKILEAMSLEVPTLFKGIPASSSPKPGYKPLIYLYGQLDNSPPSFYGDYPTESDFAPAATFPIFNKPQGKRTLLPNPSTTPEKRAKLD